MNNLPRGRDLPILNHNASLFIRKGTTKKTRDDKNILRDYPQANTERTKNEERAGQIPLWMEE